MLYVFCFFFQAEDGIRDVERSRGLGDVYKRQIDYTGILPQAPAAQEVQAGLGLQAYPGKENRNGLRGSTSTSG